MNPYIGIVVIVFVAFGCGWAAHALFAKEWWGGILWDDDEADMNDTPQDVTDYIDRYRETHQL